MVKFCPHCTTEYKVPSTGTSNDHWYWQPNKTKVGGTFVCKINKRSNDVKWEQANPGKAKAKYTRARNMRRSTPHGRLRHSISSLISIRLAGKSNKQTFKDLPYTLQDLTKHIESKFQPGMSWDNYGSWELDHIKPDSSFSYNSPSDLSFQECWSLNNLQPLWSIENKVKGNR